jgi:hypothetical protein
MITCYEGKQGSGKTASAVLDAFKRLRFTGGNLYSNMRSLNKNEKVCKGIKHDFDIVSVKSYDDLKRVTKGVVLLDEAHVWFFSRQWAKFPYDLLFFWSQARKRQLEIIYTVQDLERIDTLIRDLTDEVVRLRKFVGGIAFKWIREGSDRKYRFRWFKRFKNAYKYNLYDTNEVIWFPLEGFENYNIGINYINEIEKSLYGEDPPKWFEKESSKDDYYKAFNF